MKLRLSDKSIKRIAETMLTERMKEDGTSPADIGKSNAMMALDQIHEVEPKKRWDHIMDYYENVADTILEYGGNREMIEEARKAFDEIAGKEEAKYYKIKYGE